MTFRLRCLAVCTLLLLPACPSSFGAVDLADGVGLLLMLSEPYGANTNLWLNGFEKMGWTVTLAGLRATVAPCSFLCAPIDVDVTLDELPGLDSVDALVVSTMPGTAATVPYPAEDLRTSEIALDWVRRADDAGITLFAGCSGLLVLGDSGILEGREVACHQELIGECGSFGATCRSGGQSLLPFVDGHLITGTSGRYFAQEIAEVISWTLDGSAAGGSRSAPIAEISLDVDFQLLPSAGPALWGRAIGAIRSDGARGVCAVGSGFVIVGYTYSSPAGTSDLLALRCDSDGNILWAKAIGGPGTDVGEAVCATADGGVVAVGRTTSTGQGVDDLWLVKLDSDGRLMWSRTYGGPGPDAGFDVLGTADGGYVACGRTSSSIASASDLFVVRTDAVGKETWTAHAGGARLERGHALVEGVDGTLFVAGGTSSTGRGNYDAWLAAFSATGTWLWEKTYGLAAFDVAEDLVVRRDGSFVLVGTGDEDGKDGNDVLAARFDAAGAFVAASRIGDRMSFDYGEALLDLGEKGLLIAGACTTPSTTHNDAWLIRLAPDASVAWTQKLGERAGNEWASAMCSLPSGRVVVVGHTLSSGAGAHDVLVYLVDPEWAP